MRISDDWRAIVGCILGGFVGGLAIATTWKAESHKDFWDVLTALGTLGAVGAAVGIALWQEQARKRDASTRAKLTAPGLEAAVERNIKVLERARERLTPDANHFPSDLCRFAADHLMLYEEIPLEKLAIYSALNPSCATEMASVSAEAETLKNTLNLLSSGACAKHDLERPTEDLDNLKVRLSTTLEKLRK